MNRSQPYCVVALLGACLAAPARAQSTTDSPDQTIAPVAPESAERKEAERKEAERRFDAMVTDAVAALPVEDARRAPPPPEPVDRVFQGWQVVTALQVGLGLPFSGDANPSSDSDLGPAFSEAPSLRLAADVSWNGVAYIAIAADVGVYGMMREDTTTELLRLRKHAASVGIELGLTRLSVGRWVDIRTGETVSTAYSPPGELHLGLCGGLTMARYALSSAGANAFYGGLRYGPYVGMRFVGTLFGPIAFDLPMRVTLYNEPSTGGRVEQSDLFMGLGVAYLFL